MALTPLSKSSAVTLNPMVKAGSGWDYDDVDITYDGEDKDGRDVFYDSVGLATTVTPLNKNSVNMGGLTKNTI